MNSKSDKNLCGVLVTTEFRGVFFGYIDLAESFRRWQWLWLWLWLWLWR